jgi:hypothetical protein
VRRFCVVFALLIACKDHSHDSKPATARSEDDPEERCDPKQTKVCVGSRVVACEDGHLGRALRQCPDTCRAGRCVGSCAEGAELIYLTTDRDELLSFDPRKLPGGDPFRLIGVMNCNAMGNPFSMSVDRSGVAWVVYSDGSLFEVSTTDATCKSTNFVRGSVGSTTFGMGFVTDEAGGKTEKLYVSVTGGRRGLAYIDTLAEPPVAHTVGNLPITATHPELTGTNEGRLFGFFPVSNGTSFVQEIDKQSATFVGHELPLGDPLAFVGAYAFAQWGGVFYIFVSSMSNTVRAIDRSTGTYRMLLPDTPWRVTGAGVSTCAPEKDQGKSTL